MLTTHDLNGIAAHLPWILCLNQEVIARGTPREVITPDVLERTYGAPLEVLQHGGMPVVLETYPELATSSANTRRRGRVTMTLCSTRSPTRSFGTALLVAVPAGALCGLVGVYVVLRGMSYIGHGLSHAIFGGAVASYALGFNFYVGRAWGLVSALMIKRSLAERRSAPTPRSAS